jgi:hypothetical protein
MVTAMLLALPVAWVYRITRRKKGFTQSIVHTLIVLPVAVAGIMVLVQNSLPWRSASLPSPRSASATPSTTPRIRSTSLSRPESASPPPSASSTSASRCRSSTASP